MINFFRNVWRYRKELYYDQQWDQGYLVILVERKLRLLYECLSGPNMMGLHSQTELRRLQVAIECARRVNEPGIYMDRYPVSPNLDLIFGHDPKDPIRKAQRQASLEIHELEQRDWNLLWDTIKRYGQGWWD